MKNKIVCFIQKHKRTLIWFIPVLFFCVVMMVSSVKTPMWMDEYVFYRLTFELPKYDSHADWLFKDRPQVINPMDMWKSMTSEPFDRDFALHWIYDNKVYEHGMLAPYISYPMVKTLNTLADKGVISHVEDEKGYPKLPENATAIEIQNLDLRMNAETMTIILRLLPILLFCLSMWFIFKIQYSKIGLNAYMYWLPMLVMYQLFTATYQFYWDVFMMFFFTLTLYLMEKKSKWAYVTACCLVNTKMFIGLAFLLPLVFKNWKMIFCGFALIPWYLWIVHVNGDFFFPLLHYFGNNGFALHDYIYRIYSFKGYIIMLTMYGVPFFALLTLPIFAKYKKYAYLVVLLIISNINAWGTGLTNPAISDLVYVGALIFPYVCYEFNLFDKVSKLFGKLGVQEVEAR